MPEPGSEDPTLPLSQSPTGAPTWFGPGGGRVALPETIGPYRIIRVVGEGGMGAVDEAEQAKPRRTVALKVVRPGYVTERALRRFEHEAEVLGRLLHAGIAQIYEAGTADLGAGVQPFFAMEFVRGLPLTKFASSRNLSTHDRLELLAKVCDAVEHAHSRGVIHHRIMGNKAGPRRARRTPSSHGTHRVLSQDLSVST